MLRGKASLEWAHAPIQFGCGGGHGFTQARVTRLPRVLVMQLARFETINGQTTKCNTRVGVQLTFDGSVLTGSPDCVTFDLYAVGQHVGYSKDSGHYLWCVYDTRSGWTRYDDGRATEATCAHVLDPETCYVLFYRRRGDRPAIPPPRAVAVAAHPLAGAVGRGDEGRDAVAGAAGMD
eukprot:gene57889-biopygen21540